MATRKNGRSGGNRKYGKISAIPRVNVDMDEGIPLTSMTSLDAVEDLDRKVVDAAPR
jgi:hypothetical protein